LTMQSAFDDLESAFFNLNRASVELRAYGQNHCSDRAAALCQDVQVLQVEMLERIHELNNRTCPKPPVVELV